MLKFHSITKHQWCSLLFKLLLCLGLLISAQIGIAQSLPTVKLPSDAGEAGDLFAALVILMQYGGRAVILMLGVSAVSVVSWQILGAFFKARSGSDWGTFSLTFIVGVLMLLFIATAGQFAWSFLDSLSEL